MGNKKKLIKKGIIELFPKNIDKMIELFGGSAVISMNTKANSYYIADIDDNLVSLYFLFKNNSSEEIISHIWQRIEKFFQKRNIIQRLQILLGAHYKKTS